VGPKIETERVKIKVENCKKYYYTIDRGAIKAVDGVGFEVKEGEIFGIMGVSGAGKSTLGRIIAGIQDHSSGKAYIRIGDEWGDMSVPRMRGRGRATPYNPYCIKNMGYTPIARSYRISQNL